LAAPDGGEAVALDQAEEFLASLLAQQLADRCPERMHVLAQGRIFGGKLDALAIHNVALSPNEPYYELVG
jgi:hypothetical protein